MNLSFLIVAKKETILYFLFIERASQSLEPLRYAFNSPVKIPSPKRSGYAGESYLSAGSLKLYDPQN